MIEKYELFKNEYSEIERKLSAPDSTSNPETIKRLSKRHFELKIILSLFEELEKIETDINDSQKMAEAENDQEMKDFLNEQLESSKLRKEELEKTLHFKLIPKDPNADKNVIMEIRAGTGGDEAALFAGNLYRMYLKYAEKKNWKAEALSENKTGIEGVKEVIVKISGEDVYPHLKYESGVHRVQRVPETESQGRIHTSAATVAVLPEAQEVDIQIDPKDIRIDVFRSSGPGGQSVNTTDSAVRITHLPTGIVVSCQDEKSQLKNRDKAMSILRARLLAQKQEEEAKKRSDFRKTQVGSGDRSEKIRTYNYPQDRITDHRINFSVHNISEVMNGELEEIIGKLKRTEQEEILKNLSM